MEFTGREIKIIEFLKKDGEVINGNMLSEYLRVSSRTIRNDVRNINSRFKGQKLIFSNGNGYWLNHVLLNQINLSDNEKNMIDRLLTFLIHNSVSLTIDELADNFYVSVRKIATLIQTANQKLEKYNLQISVIKGKVSLQGSEISKRYFISAMIYEDVIKRKSDWIDSIVLFDCINFHNLKKLVHSVFETFHISIDNLYEDNLILNIGITIYRIMNSFPLDDVSELTISSDSQTQFNKLVDEVKDNIERYYQIVIDRHNLIFLRTLIYGFASGDLLFNNLNQFDEENEIVSKAVKNALYKTSEFYMIDITNKTFEKNLIIHVREMINRCRLHIFINNPLQFNIQNEYPYIYEVAIYLAVELKNYFHIEIDENEISLIAVHIGLVIDQKIKNLNIEDAIKVRILCGNYHNMENKIITYLMEKHGGKISIFDEKRSMEESADLHISILDAPSQLHNVVMISPFLTEHDYMKIDDAILSYESNIALLVWKKKISAYLDRELFFKNIPVTTKEESIDFLGSRLKEMDIVSDEYIQSVKKRESLSSTCFFGSFAIPHGMVDSSRTAIAILICDNCIKWDEHEIKIVIMLALNGKDRKNFLPLYKGLLQFLCDYEKLRYLTEAIDYNDFVNRLLVNT